MHTLYNALEFGLWLILATALTWRASSARHDSRKAPFLIAAAAFAAFGVSDLVEIQTGAWYRPWWLLVWKVSCILVLIMCYIHHRRHTENARN
jgi:hypothetical protein